MRGKIMNGEIIAIKSNCCSNGNIKEEFIDVIQINEPHECGEILNDYFLILNSDIFFDNNFSLEKSRKYKAGDYVKVVYIKALDQFISDIDYSSRNDLRLLQTSMGYNGLKNRLYTFVGENELENEEWVSRNISNLKECLEIMSGKKKIYD
jgi:hypothetical protein